MNSPSPRRTGCQRFLSRANPVVHSLPDQKKVRDDEEMDEKKNDSCPAFPVVTKPKTVHLLERAPCRSLLLAMKGRPLPWGDFVDKVQSRL